jgi:glutamate-5-semialdehyde dehydrogenase
MLAMESLLPLFEKAHKATRNIKSLSDERKKEVLSLLSERLLLNAEAILVENKKDLANMSDVDPKKDRLVLNSGRIEALAASVLQVADLKDPVNRIVSEYTRPDGLFIQNKTVPLGVIGMIYESRPNVTVDVAALCIRSGNVCILRGGSDAFFTNTCLVSLIQNVLKDAGLDMHAVQLVPSDRKYISEMLAAVRYIDVIIPRGSQQLIDFVRENSMVPVIETGAGVCHTYVEASANLEKAVSIVVNAKVSRPSVCNALDTVLVDSAFAEQFIAALAPRLMEYRVEIFADAKAFAYLKNAKYPYLREAKPEDFGREFLDLKCSIKIVDNIDDALDHINQYSSKHSEAIVSENTEKCTRFMEEVDAAAVYTNASTRFTDGSEFGLGAEIGISTQKLHARGPFALEKLVTEKWFVTGNGQVRT